MNSPSPASRLAGLDLARFLAFVGMVIVNFKIVMATKTTPGIIDSFTCALEGRAAASFVVLAGIGLGLSGLQATNKTIVTTLKRALFLLVLGLINMTIFDADILHYYAFYFLFGAFLLTLSNAALTAIILALNLGFIILVMIFDYETGWDWHSFSYEGFWTPSGFLRNLFFNGWHPVIPWLGFLLFGIILSRRNLTNRKTQRVLFAGGIAALFSAHILSATLTAPLRALDPELVELVTLSPIPPMPLYMLAGIGAASVLTGGSLLLVEPLKNLGIMTFIAPAGRQTLTLYIAHIIIGMGTLEAFDLLGGQATAHSFLASITFCIAAAILAWLWSRRFKRGLIEALMRKLAG